MVVGAGLDHQKTIPINGGTTLPGSSPIMTEAETTVADPIIFSSSDKNLFWGETLYFNLYYYSTLLFVIYHFPLHYYLMFTLDMVICVIYACDLE